MILRIVFFVLMALGLVGFGTVAWISHPPAAASRRAAAAARPSRRPRTPCWSAARPLHAGSLLKPEDLVGKEVTGRDAAATTRSPIRRIRAAQLIGAMVRRSLGAGDVLRTAT